jgi:hypothetical protein
MSERKTPILLRRGPVSGQVMALYRYTRKTVRGREVLDAGMNGKQSVHEDFETLALEWLMNDGAEDIVAILDGASQERWTPDFTDAERAQVRVLHDRIKAACERHNERVESA